MKNKNLAENTNPRNAFWVINKYLAKLFESRDAALLLAEMIYQIQMAGDIEVHLTQEEIEDLTSMTPYEQRKAFTILSDFKMVKIIRKGMPLRNFYLIDYDAYNNALGQNSQPLKIFTSSDQNPSHQVIKNFNHLYIRKNIKEKKRKEKGFLEKISISEKITISEFILTIKPKELYKDFAELQKVDLKIIFRKFLKYNRKNVFDIETWNEHLLKWFRVTYKDEKAIFSNEQITDDHKIELEIYAHLDGPKLSKRTYGISMLNYGY